MTTYIVNAGAVVYADYSPYVVAAAKIVKSLLWSGYRYGINAWLTRKFKAMSVKSVRFSPYAVANSATPRPPGALHYIEFVPCDELLSAYSFNIVMAYNSLEIDYDRYYHNDGVVCIRGCNVDFSII